MTDEEINIYQSETINREITEGEHFRRIQDTIDGDENKNRLSEETGVIVKRLNFEKQTGLVVGKVQSGKTLSFEAVTGLARDNGVHLIIILAGISKILTNQTLNRVKKDFKYSEKKDWLIEDTDGGLSGNFGDTLIKNIEKFNRTSALGRTKGTILVCMKQHQHIKKVSEIFKTPAVANALKKAKVLIIDDEADQYSLNTKPKDKDNASTTYSNIISLRESLPNHCYLSYTATPQAPLLISIVDTLSPDFAETVNPGNGYVGIEDLFMEESPFVTTVETAQDFMDDENDQPNMPPESLVEAIGTFLIGAAQGMIEEDTSNRSMLVHPSRLIGDQNTFYSWINTIFEKWVLEFKHLGEPQFEETRNFFGNLYDDLASTYEGLEDFEFILKVIKDEVFSECKVEQINSGPTATAPDIDWNSSYAFIIVAGQAMDRGTTVEGLTVTYLSRASSKNTDTQMQRARFLGYKEKYKGLIRVYLDQESKSFFQNYIITQKDFTNLVNDNSGKDFKDVKRQWMVSKGKESCRKNIVSLEGAIVVSGKGSKWSLPRSPHRSNYEKNNEVISNFLNGLNFVDSPDSGNTEATKHSEITVPFEDVFQDFFSHPDFGYSYPLDADLFTGVLYYLQHIYHWYGNDFRDEDGFVDPMMCRVININANGERRTRGIGDNGRLRGYFQGKSNRSGYIGDANIFDPNIVTLQIHSYDLYQGEDKNNIVFNDIKFPAVRLPDTLWKRFDLQTQSKKDEAPEEESE